LYAEEEAETRAGEADAASGDDSRERRAFHARLFALLLRYKSIQGYGFQSGVGPRVFATLRAAAGVAFEAFASPLNCYHTKGFCSAFPDVDAPFGTRGDFFKLADAGAFKRGAAQVNPPFVSGVMRRVAETIERVLTEASENDAPLTFVVFVPGWTDEWAWSALNNSRFLVTKFVVAAADHGYCDGAAHQRKASFRSSTYDTGVFALCSPKAQSTVAGKRFRAQNGAVFERDVREAFAGARLSEGSIVKHVTQKTAAAAAARGGKSDEKKKRKALFNGDGGEKEKDETEKTEKKRENKAAKKRRKRREEKAKQEKKALSADAGNATKTETSV
jgi:phosphorylated CTD-interacting factor 1